MSVSRQKIDTAIDIFKRNKGMLRTSEALNKNIHSRTLYKMLDEGIITKLERGVFKLADEATLANPDLVVVAAKIPKAKLCLISALDFHNMTTEIPHKIHIAIPRSSRNPRLKYPPVKVYRFSGQSLTAGIEKHKIDGIEIQVYNPAKTIADCFKFRNKIGLNAAIEGLKRGIEEDKANYADILHYAEICRVKKVIEPYLRIMAHE
jgi:predicted transcriptional regulator of viral defense system